MVEAIMTSTEKEAVGCPFGCPTVGYSHIPRLIAHLKRKHVPKDISIEIMNDTKAWLNRNKHESVVNKWRGIVRNVLPNSTNTPSPLIHTGTQYLKAIRQPHVNLLGILKVNIQFKVLPEPCPGFSDLSHEEQDATLIRGPLVYMETIIKYLDEAGMVYGTEP